MSAVLARRLRLWPLLAIAASMVVAAAGVVVCAVVYDAPQPLVMALAGVAGGSVAMALLVGLLVRRGLLTAAAAADAHNLERLREARAAEELLRAELLAAGRMQRALLPVDPRIEGLEFAARMVPLGEVSGDYYDVLPARDGCWIAIGDVAGHGMSAGMIMLMTQAAVSSTVRQHERSHPSDLVKRVNRVLYDNIRDRMSQDEYVTFSVLRFYRHGRVIYAGAHETIVVLRAASNQCEVIETEGTWIGAARDIAQVTKDADFELAPGDIVVLYSDGIVEARDPTGTIYGLDRLCRALAEFGTAQPATIVEHVFKSVGDHAAGRPPEDDRTLVVMRYNPDAAGPTSSGR